MMCGFGFQEKTKALCDFEGTKFGALGKVIDLLKDKTSQNKRKNTRKKGLVIT